jgi:hypothetical protein
MNRLIAFVVLLYAMLGPLPAAVTVFNFQMIDIPGATDVLVQDINNVGQVVGWHDNNLAFVQDHDGTVHAVIYPGTTDNIAEGINDWGKVTGYYFENGNTHGFISDASGHFTDVDYPSAVSTAPYGINNLDQIVGDFITSTEQGFFRGSFGVFRSTPYIATKINDKGEMVGSIGQNGFLRKPNGALLSIDYPGAQQTAPLDINNYGTIVGSYYDGTSYRGFIRDCFGSYSTVDFQNATFLQVTGINDWGTIVGLFIDPNTGNFSSFRANSALTSGSTSSE